MYKEKPEEQETTKPKNTGGYYIQRMPIKLQAVEEYEKGIIPIPDLLRKYGVSRTTLHNWRRQVKRKNDNTAIKRKHPEELKLRIVKEIVTKVFSISEAAAHYDLSKDSVKKWCSKYSSQLSDLNEEPVTKKKVDQNPLDTDRIYRLERALEDANLKIIGLETMINIAEKDLKIDIRKKPGTKQSKS